MDYDLFNLIMGKKYYNYSDKLCNDCKIMFQDLAFTNRLLDHKQIDKFINMITKGKSKALVAQRYYGTNNIEILNMITEKHSLKEKQISKIMDCFVSQMNDFTWIENLVKHGCEFNEKQKVFLIINGYKAGIDYILYINR